MTGMHIGLDFGTSQTKVCVFDISSGVHKFYKWDNGTFFLPSTITIGNDGKCSYGESATGNTKNHFTYFKIAAAEDIVFRQDTFEKALDTPRYALSEFGGHTPEFLSVLYIAFVLYTVKETLNGENQQKKAKGNVFSRLFSTNKSTEPIRFTIQLGIPTEWSHERNYLRKKKFEMLLYIAEEIQKKISSKAEFLDSSIEQLKEVVKHIHTDLRTMGNENLETKLNEYGLSVFPETAAGLYLITQTGQLQEGYYAIMDIGAGSTDLSFFQLSNGKVTYLASESYLLAANDVYRNFAGTEPTLKQIHQAEKKVRKLIANGQWSKNTELTTVINFMNSQFAELVYRLFNKRARKYDGGLTPRFKNQNIILYGGGGQIPIINSGKFVINDHGNPLHLNPDEMEKKQLAEFNSDRNKITPPEALSPQTIPLLAVALGLSFIKPPEASDWVDSSRYHSTDFSKDMVQVPHPSNEDMYIWVSKQLEDTLH